MEKYQRQNFLKVCYDPIRGLKLNWNFKDLNALEHYFRHIFVICSEKSDEVYTHLHSFYKKMKNGDLFCCIYSNDSYIYRVGKWVQKSQLNNFRPQRYLKDMSNRSLDQASKSKLIDAAGKQASEFDQPVVINFLGVQRADLPFFRNSITQQRRSSSHGYQYIVNLFGSFQQNIISVHSGINLFKTNVTNFQAYAQYYHKMINSAAIQTAKIQLQAMNGELSLFNEAYWSHLDFNKIGATYYGPSSSYEFDAVYFYSKDQVINLQHDFSLKLYIKLFNGKTLESSKRVKISFFKQKEYYPTFNNRKPFPFFLDKNICLSQNPQRCQIIAKYRLQREDKSKNDDSLE